MQSNGGLTDAQLFQGKDAILSGPAGGIVGMVKTGEAAGHDRLIGFDMGGTSTDVSHYAGSYERSFETEVAGVRMRAPMMDIHTVAAGGGSICKFEDGRFQVGPESAGADPGPACYRRGGPLTVTDCNVMLGKLNPAHFPAVFGPDGDQPLDADVVREGSPPWPRRGRETGEPPRSPEEMAEGFLRIAVDNMANAIKKISVQRGHDVTGYTLQCFGGAGGQHACLVADALGMKRVFIHPHAGVLSAYGMGLAEVRALREVQIDAPLAEVDAAAGAGRAGAEAEAEVARPGHPQVARRGARASALRRLAPGAGGALRQHGRHAGGVRGRAPRALRLRLARARDPVRDAERRGDRRHRRGPRRRPTFGRQSAPFAHVPVHTAPDATCRSTTGRPADAPTRASITGPAIITEPTGTNMVEPGWQARSMRWAT
jgi:5-oxoprolinase (ATP-hydrolysing)